VARVVAVFDDLLLGSNVLGALKAAGHEASLAAPSVEAVEADVLVVDLGSAGFDGVEVAERLRGSGAKLLGIYSHVHHDLKLRAEEAGFDLVVPRSRMAREGPALVERLAA
jgi:DNA-binding NarL/FixJ family response regulator